MIKWITTLSLIIVSLSSRAQLEDYKRLGIFLRYTLSPYGGAEQAESGLNGVNYLSFGVDVYNGNYEDRKLTYSLRNRVIGDFVSGIIPGNIDKVYTKGPELTSGLVGWWNVGYAIYRTKSLNIAPGIALHDYIYTSGKIEPNGYYFSAGPAVIIDYALANSPFVLHFEGSYVASLRAGAQDDELGENYDIDSENPHFINLQVEVRYKKLFFGVSPVWIVNRYGPTKNVDRGTRTDIMLGFRF